MQQVNLQPSTRNDYVIDPSLTLPQPQNQDRYTLTQISGLYSFLQREFREFGVVSFGIAVAGVREA